MGWPQIFILVWALVGLLLGAYQHGKPREGENNFIHTLIGWAIIIIPLWIGGFWG